MSHRAAYERWLNSPCLTAHQREELAALTDEEARERFYQTLAFGTAGLRGIMGMGTNRMNEYVVRQAAEAFAAFIVEQGDPEAVFGDPKQERTKQFLQGYQR